MENGGGGRAGIDRGERGRRGGRGQRKGVAVRVHERDYLLRAKDEFCH